MLCNFVTLHEHTALTTSFSNFPNSELFRSYRLLLHVSAVSSNSSDFVITKNAGKKQMSTVATLYNPIIYRERCPQKRLRGWLNLIDIYEIGTKVVFNRSIREFTSYIPATTHEHYTGIART